MRERRRTCGRQLAQLMTWSHRLATAQESEAEEEALVKDDILH